MSEYSCVLCSTEENLVIFKQSIGRRQKDLCLCTECAHSLGIEESKSQFPTQVGDLFSSVLDPAGNSIRDKRICQNCKTSFLSIRRTGMVGCSLCYDKFKDDIAFFLHRVSTASTHSGRLPDRLVRVKQLFVEKPVLYKKLQSAVDKEDYENAEEIKKTIDRIDMTDKIDKIDRLSAIDSE